jgi:uncharacterized membrane protein YdfJ with MMPL/SSD domain
MLFLTSLLKNKQITGLVKTGAIITAAGLIMTIAFAGLLLSTSALLVQFGFMLCFAVLLDTFVVRTALVPAIMHVAGLFSLNWYPGKMPAVPPEAAEVSPLHSPLLGGAKSPDPVRREAIL